jgi:hypothetical protein
MVQRVCAEKRRLSFNRLFFLFLHFSLFFLLKYDVVLSLFFFIHFDPYFFYYYLFCFFFYLILISILFSLLKSFGLILFLYQVWSLFFWFSYPLTKWILFFFNFIHSIWFQFIFMLKLVFIHFIVICFVFFISFLLYLFLNFITQHFYWEFCFVFLFVLYGISPDLMNRVTCFKGWHRLIFSFFVRLFYKINFQFHHLIFFLEIGLRSFFFIFFLWDYLNHMLMIAGLAG